LPRKLKIIGLLKICQIFESWIFSAKGLVKLSIPKRFFDKTHVRNFYTTFHQFLTIEGRLVLPHTSPLEKRSSSQNSRLLDTSFELANSTICHQTLWITVKRQEIRYKVVISHTTQRCSEFPENPHCTTVERYVMHKSRGFLEGFLESKNCIKTNCIYSPKSSAILWVFSTERMAEYLLHEFVILELREVDDTDVNIKTRWKNVLKTQ
jgi:hypothetical protein